jgi:hypothetical protein
MCANRSRLLRAVPNEEELALVVWPLGSLFSYAKKSLRSTMFRSVLFLGLPVLVLFILSWREKTLVLPGDGVGLLEHVGFLSFFTIHICVVILLRRTIGKCAKVLDGLATSIDYTHPQAESTVTALCQALQRVRKRSMGRKISPLQAVAIFIGLLFVGANFYNTTRPLAYYHHDVWDSLSHPVGYIAAKFYLLFAWGLVLPTVLSGLLYYSCFISRLYSVIRNSGDGGTLRISLLYPDGAGGQGFVHEAAVAILCNGLPLFLFTISLALLFGAISSNVLGTAGLLLLLSFFYLNPLCSAHMTMKRRKSLTLGKLSNSADHVMTRLIEHLPPDPRDQQTSTAFATDFEKLAAVSDRIARMPSWPVNISGVTQFLGLIAGPILLTMVSDFLHNFFKSP